MMEGLFVVIMPIGGKDIHIHLGIKDLINEAVLFRNFSTPLSRTVTRKWLWMTRACTRMIHQFVQQCDGFSMGTWLITAQHRKIFLRSFGKDYFVHGQSEFSHLFISSRSENWTHSPRRICSRPSSTRRRNSSLESSVGSACISATSLRKYLVARFSRLSFSAMMLMLRSISTFISFAVITSVFYGAKVSINSGWTNKRTNKKV